MNILQIGCGNMGRAFLEGMLEVDNLNITVAEKSSDKTEGLHVDTVSDAAEAVGDADIILFAIKPQQFDELIETLPSLEGKTILSMMAGISIRNLAEKTGSSSVIRLMPNLAAKHKKSVTGWIATDEVPQEHRELTATICQTVGVDIELGSEDMLDSLTPISGSGPAYVFALCSLLEQQALDWGFSEQDAKTMSVHTITGAATLLEDGDKSAIEWVQAVSSKAGITEAALTEMMENSWDGAFAKGLERGRERAEELNG